MIMFSVNVFSEDNLSKDEEYSKKILGVWVAEYKSKDRSLYGETLFKENGVKEGKGEFCQFNKCNKIYFTSTWIIKNNVVVSTVTYSNTPNTLPIGKQINDEIYLIDENQMILISESGNKQIRVKSNSPRFFKLEEIQE